MCGAFPEPIREPGIVVIHTAAIVGVAALIALLVFFWRQSGFGSGRTFGNRIAAHIGISRSLFHALLVHGVKGSPRDLLVSLERSKLDLEQASIALGPSLSRGIDRMEAHFGSQEMIDQAKPLVARLVSEFERSHEPGQTARRDG